MPQPQWAAERARSNVGATLIEFFTYRAAGHSTSDDPTRYRPADEAAHWPLGDPIARLKAHLIALGEWSDAQHEALRSRDGPGGARSGQGGRGGRHARASRSRARGTMFEDVYKEPDWRIVEQRRELGF